MLVVLATVIGLNTTLFTVLAGVALRPWPGVADPSSLVRLYLIDPSGQPAGFSLTDYRELAARTKSLSRTAVLRNESVRFGSGAATAPAEALMVSGDYDGKRQCNRSLLASEQAALNSSARWSATTTVWGMERRSERQSQAANP